MIKKRFKKIFKISILIGIRQIWKLLCNLYHMVQEPFLTLKTLIKVKDKSQIFLISLTAIMPVILYITARILWDVYKYGQILNSVGTIFMIITIIELMIFGYLGYWILKVIKK